MNLKILSYLSLLDKRRESLFVMENRDNTDPLLDPTLPAAELKIALEQYEPELAKLGRRLKRVVRRTEKKSAFRRWLERILGIKPITPDMVQEELDNAKRRCLVALIRICKRYSKTTIYLELEGVVEVDESKRRYALPAGTDGIGRLPLLISLPENRSAFETAKVSKALEFDALKTTASTAWNAAVYRTEAATS